jgi:hypothetical protein
MATGFDHCHCVDNSHMARLMQAGYSIGEFKALTDFKISWVFLLLFFIFISKVKKRKGS